MEIRVLRYFLEIAREGNMSRAAERLHVTQPTLSKQMKDLEQELGKKLFKRGSTSVSLTDEGMLLRKRAEDLLALADKITNEFQAMDDITGGDIYISVMTIVSSVRQLVETPISAINDGSSPILSYNYGARRPARVRKAGVARSIVVA